MQYKNLTVIGTSHIAKQSLDDVSSTIKEIDPDIIAIELDYKRFVALTQGKTRKPQLSDIKKIGIKGLIFNIIGAWVENKLGKFVGVKPGAEMMQAIHLAKEKNKGIALIDQDIEMTLRKISSSLTWKEKWNFIVDIIKGILFKKSQMKKLGIKDLDLTKVPPKTLIDKLVKEVKKRYPNLYKVLIVERNQIMASNLFNIMSLNPDKKIVAVVGAGHEEEIIKILKRIRPANASYSFSVNNSQENL